MTHGGKRPGAGAKRTTGTGRALRLSDALIDGIAKYGAGVTVQEHIASMLVQLESLRAVVARRSAFAGHPDKAVDALRAMLRAVDRGMAREMITPNAPTGGRSGG